MRRRRLSLGYTLVGLLVTAAPALAIQKPDPFVGTWVLNVAKSKFTPGPPPQSSTSTYRVDSAGFQVVAMSVNAAGQKTRIEFTAKLDGKDYPVSGSPDYDMVSLKRLSNYKINFTRKRAGVVVQTGSMTLSKDMNTRTVATDGSNAAGQKIRSVAVYERSRG